MKKAFLCLLTFIATSSQASRVFITPPTHTRNWYQITSWTPPYEIFNCRDIMITNVGTVNQTVSVSASGNGSQWAGQNEFGPAGTHQLATGTISKPITGGPFTFSVSDDPNLKKTILPGAIIFQQFCSVFRGNAGSAGGSYSVTSNMRFEFEIQEDAGAISASFNTNRLETNQVLHFSGQNGLVFAIRNPLINTLVNGGRPF